MLTKQDVIYHLHDHNRVVKPDWIMSGRDNDYLSLSESMLLIYKMGIGSSRRELNRQIDNLFESVENCSPKRITSFKKLLEDGGQFDRGRQWCKVRKQLYLLASKYHPIRHEMSDEIFGYPHHLAEQKIAQELAIPWNDLKENLFSDVKKFQRLKAFDRYPDGIALLSRYNVAQTQGILFYATKLKLTVKKDIKTIIQQIKLARLMHTIEMLESGDRAHYQITLDGPASVLRETTRYGFEFAKILPALLACKDWSIEASVKLPNRPLLCTFRLDSNCKLTTPIKPEDQFDSSIEQKLFEKWGDKERNGWKIRREGRILYENQKVFIPDFYFIHQSGAEVMLEIVGYWTPEYWERKLETLRVFNKAEILLAAPRKNANKLMKSGYTTIPYATSIQLKPILKALSVFQR